MADQHTGSEPIPQVDPSKIPPDAVQHLVISIVFGKIFYINQTGSPQKGAAACCGSSFFVIRVTVQLR